MSHDIWRTPDDCLGSRCSRQRICPEHFCTVNFTASSECQKKKKSRSQVPMRKFWQRNMGAIPETLAVMMSSRTSLSKDSMLSM